MTPMNQKSYLVIGGSSGIGLEVCKLLSAKGDRTIIVSASQEKLEQARNKLSGAGHLIFPYDLDDLYHIDSIFDFVHQQGIHLDGMVYSAGIAPKQLVEENDPVLAERVFRINVLSFIECVKHFYSEHISKEGSRVVGIASVTARAAGYRQTLYGSSKAAMIASVKLMAKELLNRGIHINCLSPGCTETEMLTQLYADSESMQESVKRIQPLGVIPSESVARIAVSMLSPLSDYLTGSEVVYDGGIFLK